MLMQKGRGCQARSSRTTAPLAQDSEGVWMTPPLRASLREAGGAAGGLGATGKLEAPGNAGWPHGPTSEGLLPGWMFIPHLSSQAAGLDVCLMLRSTEITVKLILQVPQLHFAL